MVDGFFLYSPVLRMERNVSVRCPMPCPTLRSAWLASMLLSELQG
jgi:hypothetical protein